MNVTHTHAHALEHTPVQKTTHMRTHLRARLSAVHSCAFPSAYSSPPCGWHAVAGQHARTRLSGSGACPSGHATSLREGTTHSGSHGLASTYARGRCVHARVRAGGVYVVHYVRVLTWV